MQIKEINKKHVEAKLYGNIGGFFTDGNSFSAMIDGFEAKGYTEVTLRMHCYGGSVFEGNVMYNAMQRTTLKVNIIVDGVAASMGCFVLPAIENVYIADNGYGMVHRPSAADFGDADDHLTTAKLLKDMEDNFIKRLTERTQMIGEEIKAKWFDGKDHWLNADEMVQYGFAKAKVPATAKNIKILDNEITQGITAQAMYDRFAACLDIDNNKNKNQMKKELIEAFKLEGVTADSSDADVLAKLKAQHSGLESRLITLEAEAKTKTASAIKTVLDNAKIEGELRKTYENIGETNGLEALAAILPTANVQPTPVAVDLAGLIKSTGSTATADVTKNWDWYQKNDPKALYKLKDDNPDQFKALYKAEYGVELNNSNK